jgi:6-phosphogluconolactonase
MMGHERGDRAVEVRVAADEAALSREAAEELVRLAQEAARARGRFSVALAGGSTPRALYALLGSEPYRSRVPWAEVHVFWGDERCVSPDRPESNFRMAQEALLARVPVPATHIHRIIGESGDPAAAAQEYERTLRAWFRVQDGAVPSFDLVLLGLGEDGHTASLFPHAAAAREERRLAVETRGGSPSLPRVTLTVPVLARARRLVWLVAGARKASVVRQVLEGPEQLEALPAQRVRPTAGTSLWLLDREAASELHAATATKRGDHA